MQGLERKFQVWKESLLFVFLWGFVLLSFIYFLRSPLHFCTLLCSRNYFSLLGLANKDSFQETEGKGVWVLYIPWLILWDRVLPYCHRFPSNSSSTHLFWVSIASSPIEETTSSNHSIPASPGPWTLPYCSPIPCPHLCN